MIKVVRDRSRVKNLDTFTKMRQSCYVGESITKVIPRTLCAFDAELDMSAISDDITQGTTLASWCKQRNLKFGEVFRWVKKSPERLQQYEDAEALRKEHLAQLLIESVIHIAMFDPACIMDDNGHIIPICRWPSHCLNTLESFKIGRDGVEVKWTPKLKAIELLGRTMGAFAETVKVKVKGDMSLADKKDGE